MAKPIRLDQTQLDWLRQNHKTLTTTAMAKEIGVCTDTLRRILAREGIRQFDGAKYTPAEPPPPLWERPCITCKSTEPRPRNHYMCPRCRRAAGYSD